VNVDVVGRLPSHLAPRITGKNFLSMASPTFRIDRCS